MPDQRFELNVVGHEPRPWGVGKSEWAWRAAVAAAARARATEISGAFPLSLPDPTAALSIEIEFRMTKPRFCDADLDNLAKPVLDTLFLARRVLAPKEAGEVSGVLFAFDDSRVTRLVLEKRTVASPGEAGIAVRVILSPSVAPNGDERSNFS